MFFDCEETSETTVTDAIGGAVITPDTIAFNSSGTVQIDTSGGTWPASDGVALTSGSFPTFGTKDFIVFSAQKLSNDLARANSYMMLHDSSSNYMGYFDGDGAQISTDGDGTILTGTETFTGADGLGNRASNAIVRQGRNFGNWTMPELVPAPVAQGNTIGAGDIYARAIRGLGYAGSEGVGGVDTKIGTIGRNDYSIPSSVTDTWQLNYFTSEVPIITEWGDYTFGTSSGGLPGVWCQLPDSHSIPSISTIQIGNNLAGQNDYYGIAIFVFEDGLPPDFKEALRWMNNQWLAGNKYIWPDWVSLS